MPKHHPTPLHEAEYELLDRLSALLESGLYSDLEIKCGGKSFRAHKAIVKLASPVLHQACEDEEDLNSSVLEVVFPSTSATRSDTSEDALAVELMLQFIYRGNYKVVVTPYGLAAGRGYPRHRPKKESGSEDEQSAADKLAEQFANDDEEDLDYDPEAVDQDVDCSVTGQVDEDSSDITDTATPASSEATACTEDESDDEKPELDAEEYDFEAGKQEVEEERKELLKKEKVLPDIRAEIVILHAKVYALGEMYKIETLMQRAIEKIEAKIDGATWHEQEVCKVVSTIFSSPWAEQLVLRDLVAKLVEDHTEEAGVSHMLGSYIRKHADLAFLLWKRAREKIEEDHEEESEKAEE